MYHLGLSIVLTSGIRIPICMRIGLCWLYGKLFRTNRWAWSDTPLLFLKTIQRSGLLLRFELPKWNVCLSFPLKIRCKFSFSIHSLKTSPFSSYPHLMWWLLKSPASTVGCWEGGRVGRGHFSFGTYRC